MTPVSPSQPSPDSGAMNHVELPGGMIRDGKVCRELKFKPLTGQLELAIAEAVDTASGMPERLTETLSVSLTSLDGEPLQRDEVLGLSVGDRQFLACRLAGLIDNSPRWMSVTCQSCGELFDTSYRVSQLPVKKPVGSFPCDSIELSGNCWHIRAPTGRDQQCIAGIEDPQEAEASLLSMLAKSSGNQNLEDLDDESIDALETAIENLSPEIANGISASCPECGGGNFVAFNAWPLEGMVGIGLMTEIHNIAVHYHWSEAEILAMPRVRRRRYLDLIDQARGVTGRSGVTA